jgi:hypothetical protein
MQNEMTDTLRMTHRVRDRYGTPLRDPQQREPLQPKHVDHGFEVAHESLERDVPSVPIREAVAAFVVTHKPVIPRERLQQVTPDRTAPVEFEMVQPVRRLEEHRSRPDGRIGDAHVIRRRTELDLRVKKRFSRGACRFVRFG